MAGHVVNRLALLAGTPAAQARDERSEWQFIIDYGVERNLLALHELPQRFGLTERSRKAIEHKTGRAANAVRALADHLPDRAVGNEFAAPHLLHGRAHRRTLFGFPLFRSGAKQIA